MTSVDVYHGTDLSSLIRILNTGKFFACYDAHEPHFLFTGDEEEFDKNLETIKNHVFFTTDFKTCLDEYAIPFDITNPSAIIKLSIDERLLLPDIIDSPHAKNWKESSLHSKQVMVKSPFYINQIPEIWVVHEKGKAIQFDINSVDFVF